jgi:hypothetical protein
MNVIDDRIRRLEHGRMGGAARLLSMRTPLYPATLRPDVVLRTVALDGRIRFTSHIVVSNLGTPTRTMKS